LRFLQALDCKERGWEKGDKFEHSVCCCNWRIAEFCSLSHWAKTQKEKEKEKGWVFQLYVCFLGGNLVNQDLLVSSEELH
jgi:hypothetical protein